MKSYLKTKKNKSLQSLNINNLFNPSFRTRKWVKNYENDGNQCVKGTISGSLFGLTVTQNVIILLHHVWDLIYIKKNNSMQILV